VCEHFGLIWDDAEELARLARLSHPKARLDTSGQSPEATALANHLAREWRRLSAEDIAAMHAILDKAAKRGD
jgi:hypothetical protein